MYVQFTTWLNQQGSVWHEFLKNLLHLLQNYSLARCSTRLESIINPPNSSTLTSSNVFVSVISIQRTKWKKSVLLLRVQRTTKRQLRRNNRNFRQLFKLKLTSFMPCIKWKRTDWRRNIMNASKKEMKRNWNKRLLVITRDDSRKKMKIARKTQNITEQNKNQSTCFISWKTIKTDYKLLFSLFVAENDDDDVVQSSLVILLREKYLLFSSFNEKIIMFGGCSLRWLTDWEAN